LKSMILRLSWRFPAGIIIAAIGVIVSEISHDWKIEDWFVRFGFLMIALATLPLF
jgi:hypothetical protein